MTDDEEDLIGNGPEEPVPKKRGRPSKADLALRAAKLDTPKKPAYGGQIRADASVAMALMNPVTISFLAQVLEMDRLTVNKKLAKLPPIGMHRGGTPVYNFKQAMSYLAAPVLDPAEIMKRISAQDLPPSLQKDVWDAKLKMQKWLTQAGDLWPTEDVLETLGDAFKRLKTTTQLWIDQITESQALPVAVRDELTVLVDALQMDLHRALVEMPNERATRNQTGEIEGTELDG